MKGVILSRNPRSVIVDISHDVEPYNLPQASYLLRNSFRYFPKGATFVCVVDPGVGSARRIVAIEAEGYTFLAPDNGILGFLTRERKARIHAVEKKMWFLPTVSSTFHGRDIFAPVAAEIAGGKDISALGRRLDRIATLGDELPRRTGKGIIQGRIIAADRFGNLVTNIPSSFLPSRNTHVEINLRGKRILGFRPFYDAPGKGRIFALIGSGRNVEISAFKGSAAALTRSGSGDPLTLRMVNR